MIRETRLHRLALLCAWASATLFLFACGSTEPEEPPPNVPHALHSNRLRATMRQLSLLTTERLPQEFNAEGDEKVQRERISDVALDLAKSVPGIRAVLDKADLTESQRHDYTQLADQLETRTREMHEQAGTLPFDALEQRVSGIVETCTACHTRFRVLPYVDGL